MRIIHSVVQRHVDEIAILYGIRGPIASGSAIRLGDLQRLDDRLLAHFDGVSVAGDEGWQLCEAALDEPSAGAVFAATVGAIEAKRPAMFERVLALCDSSADCRRALIFALAWLEPQQLQGIVANLLGDERALRRAVGIAACGVHRVDPGIRMSSWTQDESSTVRAAALRAAGELGRQDLVSVCAAASADEDPECRGWGVRSAVLLGNRGKALEDLAKATRACEHDRLAALNLVLQSKSTTAAHDVLQDLAGDPRHVRWLIHGSGIAGDPIYVPWLIKQMADEKTARLAGEAFSLVTGVDLAALSLERPRPENFDAGPTDNPDDENVLMDHDEGLAWPDPERIQLWWNANGRRFAAGSRYFIGEPVTRQHCIDVLKNGYQRQRVLAAHYLCLLEPGTPLFNTSAPAWRQQRLLAKLT